MFRPSKQHDVCRAACYLPQPAIRAARHVSRRPMNPDRSALASKSFLDLPIASLRRWPGRSLLMILLLILVPTAHANPFETVLDNGLKVVVREDRRAPSVVHMVWYRVGSMDEPIGLSGVAHVLEHMMFKGTRNVGPGEFNRLVAEAGGRDNAFTSRDYTAYFQQIPPAALGQMMQLEADRMGNLVIDDAAFAREIEVVKEERRLRTEDQPRSLLYEQLLATAFQSHPYRRPVIGWMPDIEAMRADDARAWHDTWYVPNNAIVVVVGDVDHEAVFALAREHYGALEARPLPARRTVAEPPQRGERLTVVRAPAELPFTVMTVPVPGLQDPVADRIPYALDVLSSLLSGDEGARLPRQLVRDRRIAISAGAGYDGIGRGPSLFSLSGDPAGDTGVDALETALIDIVRDVAENGIDEAELSRIKAQALASEVFKRDSLMGQAMEIGYLEAVGLSWRDEAALLAGLRRVTAEDVQAAARLLLDPAQRTTARLHPLPLDRKRIPRTPLAGMRH